MRALLIEDDLIAARGTSMAVRGLGAIVDEVDTGEEGIELARRYDYDIIIVDLMLPDIEGYEVIRRLRLARVATPVLILSGLSRPQAKVRGLGVGADDFITKPFDRDELVARIQAIVRRSKGFSQEVMNVGNIEMNFSSKEVKIFGKYVHLTGKEFSILELLMMRRGSVITKETFLNHLYGGIDEPEIKIIDVFICKLRKKLQALGADEIVTTVWGRGYMLKSDTPSALNAPKEFVVPRQRVQAA
jgi:two-component system cell cycle response regulator CtrA